MCVSWGSCNSRCCCSCLSSFMGQWQSLVSELFLASLSFLLFVVLVISLWSLTWRGLENLLRQRSFFIVPKHSSFLLWSITTLKLHQLLLRKTRIVTAFIAGFRFNSICKGDCQQDRGHTFAGSGCSICLLIRAGVAVQNKTVIERLRLVHEEKMKELELRSMDAVLECLRPCQWEHGFCSLFLWERGGEIFLPFWACSHFWVAWRCLILLLVCVHTGKVQCFWVTCTIVTSSSCDGPLWPRTSMARSDTRRYVTA